MRILGVPTSPFVQRCLIVARAKGHEIEAANPPGMDLTSPEFLAISPMGRIPVLETDGGAHICESLAIAGYLDDVLPGDPLMPADPLARARVREIVSLAQGELAVGGRQLMVHLVFKMADCPDIVAAARMQIDKGLDALERLIGDDFAVGGGITDADAALFPILTLFELIDGPTQAFAAVRARPKVADYFARGKDDAVLGRTVTEMRDGFAKMMARRAALKA
ncbi:GST N-terminal domain-containing protein [Sphingomonas antarctica]|uniref:glutathione S-transferase family protein n=1 Tax=Sphingomonas antarctica TaxID=2040274 RepID=UPI0039E867BD